jgi:hypothetical protein
MQFETDNLVTPGVAAALSRTGRCAVAALDPHGPDVTTGDLMAAERERERRGLPQLRLEAHVRWTQQVVALLPGACSGRTASRAGRSRRVRRAVRTRSGSRAAPGRSTGGGDPPLPPDIASRDGEAVP